MPCPVAEQVYGPCRQASQFEIDWPKTFFGDHYDTLKMFVVTEGVGSEEWNKNLTCRF